MTTPQNHGTSSPETLSLPEAAMMAVVADTIQDTGGLHEIAHEIATRRALGETAVHPNEVMPELPPVEQMEFHPIYGMETRSEKKAREANEVAQNKNLIQALMGIVPTARYQLSQAGTRRNKIELHTTTDPYLQSALVESIIWANGVGGYVPCLPLGKYQIGDTTNLLLASLAGDELSTLKWAQWKMIKTDLSGGPSIPIRNSGTMRYSGADLYLATIPTDVAQSYTETLPSRIRKRALALDAKQQADPYHRETYPINLAVNPSESQLMIREGAIELVNRKGKPFVDGDFVRQYGVAEQLARTANMFQVGEAFAELAQTIVTESQ